MMAKTKKKKTMKAIVFPRSGIDLSMMLTRRLMLGTLLKVLRGLKTLKARSILKLGTSSPNKNVIMISKMLESTTKKSTKFQLFFKYAFLCWYNPWAMIFITASRIKK